MAYPLSREVFEYHPLGGSHHAMKDRDYEDSRPAAAPFQSVWKRLRLFVAVEELGGGLEPRGWPGQR